MSYMLGPINNKIFITFVQFRKPESRKSGFVCHGGDVCDTEYDVIKIKYIFMKRVIKYKFIYVRYINIGYI